jgi:hypothetical protein
MRRVTNSLGHIKIASSRWTSGFIAGTTEAMDEYDDTNGRGRSVPTSVTGLASVRDLALPILVTSALALTLIPVPRAIAWIVLLAVPAVLGHSVSRTAGITAAGCAGMLFMWAHGRPRFASTVTDPSILRASFLLVVAGVAVTFVARWWRDTRDAERVAPGQPRSPVRLRHGRSTHDLARRGPR